MLAARSQLPDISEETIEALIDKYKEEGKGALTAFVDIYDVDPQKIRDDHYTHLIELTRDHPNFFDDNECAYGGIAQLRIAGVKTHIITHGSPSWTQHTNSQNKRSLSDFFKDETRYTTKDEMPDHSGKNRADIYERALDKTNLVTNPHKRGEGFAMVEDTMSNLKAAKELGMMTIFINRKNIPIEDVAEYVDVIVDNTYDAIQSVSMSNAFHERMAQNHAPEAPV